MKKSLLILMAFLCIPLIAAGVAHAGPFVPQGPFVAPIPGHVIPGPKEVPSKEYSDVFDTTGFPTHTPDPGQVIAWDGAGGTKDTTDFQDRFSISPLPDPFQVDALANSADVLFDAVINNQAALLFSVGIESTVRPLSEAGQNYIYAEGIDGSMTIWASPSDINQVGPFDVDALEVWGVDPTVPIALPPFELETSFNDPVTGGANAEGIDDANRYSLFGDSGGVSVYDSNGGTIFTQDDIAGAIGRPDLTNDIDLDAMMMNAGGIMFSITPIDIFDGGEIWVWDGAPGSNAAFLSHGGHLWNSAFDVSAAVENTLNLPYPFFANENINALESVATPEPATMLLLGSGLLGLAGFSRKKFKKS